MSDSVGKLLGAKITPSLIGLATYLTLDVSYLTLSDVPSKFASLVRNGHVDSVVSVAGKETKSMTGKSLFGTVLAYGSLCVALHEFVLKPAAEQKQTATEAARRGALLGLACSGCFDGTLLASDSFPYPLDFALQDVAWGMTVMAISAAATAEAAKTQRQRSRQT